MYCIVIVSVLAILLTLISLPTLGWLCCFRYVALLVVSLVCYVATFAFNGLLFHFFTPSGQDCGLNTFFIVMTLILIFGFAVVTLHPSVGFVFLFPLLLHNNSLFLKLLLALNFAGKHATFIYIHLLFSFDTSICGDYKCGFIRQSRSVSVGS